MSCEEWSLESRLKYYHTSEELDSMENRISSSIYRYFEGSEIRQMKWDTLIAINPAEEEYYRRKSFAHTRIGDYHLAFPLIKEAIDLDPMNALYFSGWQLLYLYRDYPKVIDYLSYYDDINPGTDYSWGENIHYLKGLAYKQMGLYDQAVDEFDICIETEKNAHDEYVYVYRGIANLRNECISSAIEDFEIALERNNRCTMALVYKAEAKIYDGDFGDAIDLLNHAAELLENGVKKTHPYVEVFDEVQSEQVDDLLKICKKGIINNDSATRQFPT